MNEKDSQRIILHHSPFRQENFFPHDYFENKIRLILSREESTPSFPLVELIPPEKQDDYLSISAIAEATQELVSSPSDILSFSIPHGTLFSSFSTNRILFSINTSPERKLLFIESKGFVEDQASCLLLQEQNETLRQTILFTLEHPTIAQHLATPFLRGKLSLLIRKGLLGELARKNKKNQLALVEELQRFLLATDDSFKSLRTPEHLLKLILSHNALRDQQHNKKEALLFFKIFPTELHFPFGSKEVLSLIVSLRALSAYEHFDYRHMLQACKRILPSLELIPESFYTYQYANESTRAFHLELAPGDGSNLTVRDRLDLKERLEQELSLAIEHVVTRIDIPPNEDDVLRNILLLSQEIKNVRDPPQVIIQFQGQSDTSLNFHVTLVHLLKEANPSTSLPSFHAENIQFQTLSSTLVDKLRNKYYKESFTFLVKCQKDAFLRLDHSVDFLKARESVRRALEDNFGKVRDLNGGLIYQQTKLLDRVEALLTEEETRDFFFVQKLFHSLTPSLMKNLLGPEHILTVFRQLRTLKRTSKEKGSQGWVRESYEKEAFFGCICPGSYCHEEFLRIQEKLHIAQEELALFQIDHEETIYSFVICLHTDEKQRTAFIDAIEASFIEEQQKRKFSPSLRISLPHPTLILDPRLGTDLTSSTVIKMLYEGLMRLGPQGIPTHAIAEEVLLSDNGKQYTFNLRPTLWSNGKPVTAYDFAYAWKKILDPSFKTIFHHFFHPIKNARLVKEGKLPIEALGITALSEKTLVVELERPTPHFLELCCLWIYSPLCKDVDSTRPGWSYYGGKSYACNGPFKLDKWSKQAGVRVVKNDLYWDQEHVSLENVDISIVEDPIQAIKMFEEGTLDWIGEPLSEVPANIMKQKSLALHSQPLSASQWYFLNTRKRPFSSQKLRHAFSYALDRNAIIRECLYGDERASKSVLPSSFSLFDMEDPFPYSPEKATQLFEEGLADLGLSPSSMRSIKMVILDREPHRSVAHSVARFWERAFGVSTIIDAVDWQEFFEKISDASYDVIACAWHALFHDPLSILEMLQYPTSPVNMARWENNEFASLVERASLEEKKEERTSLLKEAEKVLIKELPIIPLFEYNSRYMTRPDVDHVYVSHMGSVDFKWTTCSRHREENPIDHISTQEETRLYLQAEPLSLDPRVGGNHFSQLLLQELFEGLTARAQDGSVSLALADSFSLSEDNLEYTFLLKKAYWSNGEVITAQDFEATWKELLHPNSSIPTAFSHTLFLIRNAKQALSGKVSTDEVGIRALDEKTLLIQLEHPAPYFLELLSNPFFSPVPKSLAKNIDWSTKTHPEYVCNGPFLLKEHVPRSYLLLEKNPLYWNRANVRQERLRFTIIEDPRVAYSLFKAKELDWYGDPFGTPSLESSQGHSSGAITHKRADGLYWLACRTNMHHLSSAKVRKAIAMAINRKEICDALHCNEEPARSLVLRSASLLSHPTFEDNQPLLAKQLFEEGIRELGYSIETYPTLVINNWDDPTAKTIAKMVQQQLTKHLHIHVEIAFQGWDTYMKKILDGNFHLFVACWFPWIRDPIYTLEHLKYSENGINATAWSSKEYSELLDLAETTSRSEERINYLLRAETLALQELPLIPILHKTFTYIKASNLSGEKWLTNGLVDLRGIEKSSIDKQKIGV